jgi:hypothetical protein
MLFFLLGPTTSAPPPTTTDLSSVPPVGPTLPSYQDSKPVGAWNDPPTVLIKASKPNPAKVNYSIPIIPSNHLFS